MTPRRRQKTAEVELSDEQERELSGRHHYYIIGFDDPWAGSAFDSEEEIERAWEAHGERITERYVVEHPGERPACWWTFETEQGRPPRQPPLSDRPPGFRDGATAPLQAVVLHLMGELRDEEYEALSAPFETWLNERGRLELTDEEREALRFGDLEEGP